MNGDGTDKHVVIPFDKSTHGYGRFPEWSPDGQHFAYLYAYDQGETRWYSIWVADRDGSHPYQVGKQTTKPAAHNWNDSNTLFVYFVYEGPFPGVYNLTTGTVTERVLPSDYDDYEQFICSPGCHKIAGIKKEGRGYFILDLLSEKKVVVFEIPEGDGEMGLGAWSPDGDRLAFTYFYRRGLESFCDLYIVQADGQDLHRLTDFWSQFSGKGSSTNLIEKVWSPDGEWIAFLLKISGESLGYLGVIPAEGGSVTNLGVACRGAGKPVWSPDSTKIAFVSNARFVDGRFPDPYNDLGQWDIYAVDIHTKEIQRLTNDTAVEMHIDWK